MSGGSGNQLVLFSSSPVRVTRENTACCSPQNLTFSVYYRSSYITSNNWKKTTLADISSLLKDFVRATPRITLHSLKKTGKTTLAGISSLLKDSVKAIRLFHHIYRHSLSASRCFDCPL